MSGPRRQDPRPAPDASPQLLAQLRRPAKSKPRLSASEGRDWSEFGSRATDKQRINLHLAEAGGARVFCHAGHVLDGRLAQMVEDAKLVLPAHLLEPLAVAARRFLEAAESVVAVHRTRLYLDPLQPSGNARSNGVVLEWKDRDPSRSAIEAVALEAFRNGQWAGLDRSRDPRHTLAVRSLMDSAGALADALRALSASLTEARIAVRTFEPERGSIQSPDFRPPHLAL